MILTVHARMYVILSMIWYHLYNLKNKKITHGGVLLLVKLQAKSIPPWMFFTFVKLYKWCQIAQNVTYALWWKYMGNSLYIFVFSFKIEYTDQTDPAFFCFLHISSVFKGTVRVNFEYLNDTFDLRNGCSKTTL